MQRYPFDHLKYPRPYDCEHYRSENKPRCCPYRRRSRLEPPPLPGQRELGDRIYNALYNIEPQKPYDLPWSIFIASLIFFLLVVGLWLVNLLP